MKLCHINTPKGKKRFLLQKKKKALPALPCPTPLTSQKKIYSLQVAAHSLSSTSSEMTYHTLLDFNFLHQPSAIILTLAIELLLQWALAILWKNPVFSSPSFNHTSQYFCLHDTSSNKTHFLYTSLVAFLASNSCSKRDLAPSLFVPVLYLVLSQGH